MLDVVLVIILHHQRHITQVFLYDMVQPVHPSPLDRGSSVLDERRIGVFLHYHHDGVTTDTLDDTWSLHVTLLGTVGYMNLSHIRGKDTKNTPADLVLQQCHNLFSQRSVYLFLMTVLQMVDDVIEALIHIVIADDFWYEIVKRINNFGVHAFRLHVMFRLSVWSRQIATLATLLPRLSPLARTMADSLLSQRNDYHLGYSQNSRRAPLFVFEFEEALFAFT